MRSCFLFLASLPVLLGASPLPAATAESALELSFAGADLSVARVLPLGGSVRLLSVPLDAGAAGTAVLELRRIRVFGPGAVLRVQRAGGAEALVPPATVYLSGGVAGSPRSRAFLAVRESGALHGLVADSGRLWIIEQPPGAPAPRVAEIAADAFAEKTSSWRCATDELDADAVLAGIVPALTEGGGASSGRSAAAPSAASTAVSPDGGALYTARIAFETDTEFLAKFGGNTTAAVDYIGDLVAFGTTIYGPEVDTTLEVSAVNLWLAPDPWQQAQGSCALYEFGRYWNDNNQGVSRSIAHFLSGRAGNVGVAWVGVLCRNAFNTNITGAGCSMSPPTDNYGGDYGYTGGIDGNFDLNNPAPVWDIIGATHEIGHNFNSPHTHCYANLGGNPNPVDQCHSGQCGQTGCWCGGQSLPCATPGAGCGTIMSYCHLLAGNLSNISFTFGEGHPWGTAPGRVPDRMAAHVVSQAGLNPGCLDFFQGNTIFADGFESGNTSAWSASVG